MDTQTVRDWVLAKAKLDQAKALELELRNEICDHILDGKIKGAKKGTIGPFVLTATAKLNAKIDKELLHSMWGTLTNQEKKCIKFDPKVVSKELKKIGEDSDIFRAIEEKPGTPSLSIKEK